MRAAEIALDAVESAILALLCVLAAVCAVLGILWEVTVIVSVTVFLSVYQFLKRVHMLNLLAAFLFGLLAQAFFDVPIWQGFVFSLFVVVGVDCMVRLVLDKR